MDKVTNTKHLKHSIETIKKILSAAPEKYRGENFNEVFISFYKKAADLYRHINVSKMMKEKYIGANKSYIEDKIKELEKWAMYLVEHAKKDKIEVEKGGISTFAQNIDTQLNNKFMHIIDEISYILSKENETYIYDGDIPDIKPKEIHKNRVTIYKIPKIEEPKSIQIDEFVEQVKENMFILEDMVKKSKEILYQLKRISCNLEDDEQKLYVEEKLSALNGSYDELIEIKEKGKDLNRYIELQVNIKSYIEEIARDIGASGIDASDEVYDFQEKTILDDIYNKFLKEYDFLDVLFKSLLPSNTKPRSSDIKGGLHNKKDKTLLLLGAAAGTLNAYIIFVFLIILCIVGGLAAVHKEYNKSKKIVATDFIFLEN